MFKQEAINTLKKKILPKIEILKQKTCRSFYKLIGYFISLPFLIHPDAKWQIKLEIDVLHCAISEILIKKILKTDIHC